MKLIITGTPATGKTTLGREISKLTGAHLVEITEFVKARKLGKKDSTGEIEVEPAALEKALAGELKGRKDFIVEGHLACEIRLPADAVIVLRCDPLKLRARYRKRGYSAAKAKENLLAEALDYCIVRAEINYGRGMVLQLDATKERQAAEVLAAVKEWKPDKVDWVQGMMPGKSLAFLLKGG